LGWIACWTQRLASAIGFSFLAVESDNGAPTEHLRASPPAVFVQLDGVRQWLAARSVAVGATQIVLSGHRHPRLHTVVAGLGIDPLGLAGV
jgi:hypothetical protein